MERFTRSPDQEEIIPGTEEQVKELLHSDSNEEEEKKTRAVVTTIFKNSVMIKRPNVRIHGLKEGAEM
jgi:hypothetical protein